MTFEEYLWDTEMLEEIIKQINKNKKGLLSQRRSKKIRINFTKFSKNIYYVDKKGIYNPNNPINKNEKNIDVWKNRLREIKEIIKAGKRIINSNLNRELLNETKKIKNNTLAINHLHNVPLGIRKQVEFEFLNTSCVNIIESKLKKLQQAEFEIKWKIRELEKKSKTKEKDNKVSKTPISSSESGKTINIQVNNQISKNKIINLRINKLLKIKNRVLITAENKFTALKTYKQYSDFYENYENSLKIIEKLGTNITYKDLIDNMVLLKKYTAKAIAHYLNLIRTYDDEERVSKENISSLIELYEKAYEIFEKNIKKLTQEEKKLLIETYKKDNNLENFLISNFNKESMMKLSKENLIKFMIKDKYLYEISSESEALGRFLSPIDLIVDRSKYLSLEEVGEIYRRISHDLLIKEPNHSFDNKQLQMNFIKAIYILMKQKGMIEQDEKLTVKLEAEICSKYLNNYLEEEKNKKVLT